MSSDYIDKITASNGTTYDITGIFIAEYGTTTFDELEEAYNNKRLVFVLRLVGARDDYYILTRYTDGASFIFTSITSVMAASIACYPDDTWEEQGSITFTDKKVEVAENTKSTKYYPILATGTGTATRQIDTNDKNDSSASTSGLWYQNGMLCAPSLQIGDVDYTITTGEYDNLMAELDEI